MLRAAPTPAPSTWDRVYDYASDVEQVVDAPVYDVAAIIGVDAALLGGLLLGIKAVWLGLHMTLKKRGS